MVMQSISDCLHESLMTVPVDIVKELRVSAKSSTRVSIDTVFHSLPKLSCLAAMVGGETQISKTLMKICRWQFGWVGKVGERHGD